VIECIKIYLFCKANHGKDLSGKISTYFQYAGVILISTLLFLCIPDFFFDDAGFVLRYLENFRNGYWFRYNITDGPVYGISGYIHGCFTGILCFLHLAKPELALKISNYTGFILSAAFLYGIFTTLVKPRWKAIVCWFIAATTCKMYITVARCGLETPLHISLMLGAVFFLLSNRTKLFYVFTALFITSKLDAVPVAAVLLGLNFLKLFFEKKGSRNIKKILLDFFLCFVLIVTLGLGSIYLTFGNILPQSAYAKLYYHGHPDNSWFPFLEYFTDNKLRLALTGLLLLFGILHSGEILFKKKITLSIHYIFGLMFLSVMAMYYWYNPGEKMMWYYAMPEMLLYLQIIYSFYYFIHGYFNKKIFTLGWLGTTFIMAALLWITVYNGIRFLQDDIRPVENERTALGNMIATMSDKDDILLSYHGLISYRFPGYVLDGSGLNSKIVTDLKRNDKTIIEKYSPDFIVNHAFEGSLEIYNQFNYELVGIYRDVSERGYLPWVVLKKTNGKKHLLKTNAIPGFRNDELHLNSIDIENKDSAFQSIIHVGMQALEKSYIVHVVLKSDKTLKEYDLEIPAQSSSSNELSKYVYDITIDLNGYDGVKLSSIEKDWLITDPIFELIEK